MNEKTDKCTIERFDRQTDKQTNEKEDRQTYKGMEKTDR
jgi:hypothetical protein